MLLRKSKTVRNEYEKLPGNPPDIRSGVQRLHLGPNHLLMLELKGGQDKARRFYYADIMAIRQEVTIRGRFIDAAFVAAALAAWAPALLVPDLGRDWAVFSIPVTVFVLIALAVHAFRGPTCKTWIHTTNHTELLSGLSRYRASGRALAMIHERIAAAQGSLESETPSESFPPFSPYAPPTEPRRAHAVRPHNPRLMRLAFRVSLALAAFSFWGVFYEHAIIDAISVWLVFAMSFCCAIGIIQSYDTNCPPSARKSAFTLLAFATLGIPIALLVIGALVMAGLGPIALNGLDPTGMEGPPSSLELILNIISGTVHAVFGFIGLLALRRAAESEAPRL